MDLQAREIEPPPSAIYTWLIGLKFVKTPTASKAP
jgi:hypothetical protein